VTITGTKSDMKFGVDQGKLKKQIFSRHKDKPEVKTEDDKIVGDPDRIQQEPKEKAEGPASKVGQQQQE
jgi:hypothetical protein